jgi:thiol-disulfide isomerase/thioredoxin
MPFGAVYATLFFTVVAFWLAATGLSADGGPLAAARLCLALVSLVLGLALILRRSWARWLGALVALALIVIHLWAVPLGEGVAAHLVLFGSVAAMILLAVPGTGDVKCDLGNGKRLPAPRLGRTLALVAGLGLAGAATGVWLGALRAAPAVSLSTDGVPARAAIAGLSDRVAWTSFGQGIEQARAGDRPILLTFIADWCGYCRKMDRTTWKDPQVVRRAADLVAVRVDAEDGLARDGFTGRDLAREYRVQGFPTLLLLDPDGHEIARTSGYHNAGDLLAWVDESLPRLRGQSAADGTAAVSSR